MNFKKLLIIVIALVVLIGAYKFFTRLDHTNATAVGTAFTNALKKQDIAMAASYVVPAQAEAWRTKIADRVGGMKSGTKEGFYERIPASPDFSPIATVAGKSMLVTSDKAFSLEMSQVDGKWYVTRTDFE